MKVLMLLKTEEKCIRVVKVENDTLKDTNLPMNTLSGALCKENIIIVTDLFLILSEKTRNIILEHEVAHIIGIMDEVEADKRAISIRGEEDFIEAVKESLTLMRLHSINSYTDEEFNDIINKRINLALGVDINE